MKIVVATGLFPPDVGGPSLYGKGIAEALEKFGYEVPIAWFGRFRAFPSGIRHAVFLIQLWYQAGGASAIFALDASFVGMAATLVGVLRGVPVVVRVGGDFVWESYIERTKELIPLPEFYKARRTLTLKERFARRMVRWTLRHAHPAFNTEWLLAIWKEPYHLDEKRMHVVRNVIPARASLAPEHDRSVLLYGRPIALKNVPAFSRAFHNAVMNLELKTGTIPHADLMQQMRNCYAVAVPSISEVAPNTIIEALCWGKPFILTKYSGYAELYKDFGIIVDPLDEADMERAVKEIADPAVYERLRARIGAFTKVRTYKEVAQEMVAMLENV